MKRTGSIVFDPTGQPCPLYRIGARYLALLICVLAVVGCGPGPHEPLPIPTSPTTQKPREPAKGPPPVVFIEYVGTPHDVVERMLKLANVTEDDVLCDLGCGDGRILVAAARRYGCRAVGYDLDPLRVTEARKNAEQNNVAHLVTIEQKDVLTVNLEGISVVALYMGTEINARLIPQLRKLEAGSRIVSHDFGLADIPPDKTAEMTSRFDGTRHRIYLWRCPLSPGP